MKSASTAGGVFAFLFLVGVVALGDLLGSFADSDDAFKAYFSDGGNRAGVIVGSFSLILAGYALVWFAYSIADLRDVRRTPIVVTASMACGGMIVAGLALATVPLSISFGDLTDDPGLGVGQAVLPQFGYVSLVIGAMFPAAAHVIVIARTPNLLPRWLKLAGYALAALLLLAFTVAPLLLLGIWAAAVSVALRRSGQPVAADHP